MTSTTAFLVLDTRHTNRKDEFPIKIRLFHKRKQAHISLGRSCKEHQWIDGRVKNYPNSGKVNAYLSNELTKVNKVIDNHTAELEPMNSATEVKNFIIDTISAPQKKEYREKQWTLRKWADILIKRKRQQKSNATADWYNDGVNFLLNFKEVEDIAIADINHTLLEEANAYHLGKGGGVNGVGAYMRALRAIINYLNKEHGTSFKPFDNFTIKTQKTRKRAVKKDVIQEIRKVKLNTSEHDKTSSADWNAKNYLLFMFNCRGMNFIDITRLEKKHFVEQKFKNKMLTAGRIHYMRSKTSKLMSIKLTEEAISILNSYDFYSKDQDEKVFPIGYDDTKTGHRTYKKKRDRYNRRFKKIAKNLGLDTNFTSYVIRHSWASIAKRNNVPMEAISEAMGHADIRTTEIYVEDFDNEILDDINDSIVN